MIVDVDGDTNIAEDEAMTETFFDGAGRPLRTRSSHPGSTGEWSAVKTTYDILGRVASQSVPTEVSVNGTAWTPAGDDAAGYKWTYQKYDWMGRVVRKINTDGIDQTAYNDSDTLISYAGCGCAGGVETTVQGPLVPDDDGNPATNSRRKQKVYQDILGRTVKTEAFEWNGSTVYSTVVNSFNGRDQTTSSVQYAGTTSGTSQQTTAAFDGFGRMVSSHKPEQWDGSTLKYTTYSYNEDDSIQTVTDARGAVTNYEYNVLGLPIEIGWTVPGGSGITVPGTVTFDYDNVGNRKWMDRYNVSKTTYAYDSLSRITSETVEFHDLEDPYTVAYTYHIGGTVKSVTDPFSAVVTYEGDKAGRTTAVNGSGFASVSNYASGIKYRAFGGLKQMTYGSSDSSVVSYTYDAALRPLTYQATSSVLSGFVRKAAYEYNADGSPKFVDDQKDGRFDQAYAYDHLGRLTGTTSGLVTNSENEEVPAYAQMIAYNAFGNMTSRSATVWGGEPLEFTASYANNRKTGGNEVFDFEGHIVDKTSNADNYTKWKFDASGSVTEYKTAYETHVNPYYDYTHTLTQIADGDGRLVKRHSHRLGTAPFPQNTIDESDVSYFVHSTVLGGRVLTEINGDGEKVKTSVFAGGAEIAEQRAGATDQVVWKHIDAITASRSTISANGNKYLAEDSDFNAEFEPVGRGAIPGTDPYPGQSGDPDTWPMPTKFKLDGNIFNVKSCQAYVHSAPLECTQLKDLASSLGMPTLGGFIWFEIPYEEYGLLDNESRYADALVNEGMRWRMFGDQIGFLIGSGSTLDLVSIQESDISKVKADIASLRVKLSEKCKNNLKDFLLGAVKKKFGDGIDEDGLKYYGDVVLQFDKVLDDLSKGSITSSAIHREDRITDAIYNNRNTATFGRRGESATLDVTTKYFYDVIPNQIRGNNDAKYQLARRSEKDRGYTLLHEAIHSIISDFHDPFFAEFITAGKVKETDKDAFEKGSKMLTEKIKELCP